LALHPRATKQGERFLDRLEKTLRSLPDDDIAILRQEALASELKGKRSAAIAHRKREIQMMERLQGEAASPKYSPSTRAYMLRDRDSDALRERRAILKSLARAQGQIDD